MAHSVWPLLCIPTLKDFVIDGRFEEIFDGPQPAVCQCSLVSRKYLYAAPPLRSIKMGWVYYDSLFGYDSVAGED